MYGICILFIKLSILLQLLEIFGRGKDFFFWFCHVTIWGNLLFYLIYTFVQIFACHPLSKSWDFLTTGSCLNIRLLNVIAGTLNALSDVIILILPQLRIWRLQMTVRRKIAISTVFLFGVLWVSSGPSTVTSYYVPSTDLRVGRVYRASRGSYIPG